MRKNLLAEFEKRRLGLAQVKLEARQYAPLSTTPDVANEFAEGNTFQQRPQDAILYAAG